LSRELYFYAITDDAGVQVIGYRSSRRPVPGVRNLVRVTDVATMQKVKTTPRAFRIADGAVIESDQVTLSATPKNLAAVDGAYFSVYVAGVPDNAWPVTVAVNGVRYQIEKGDPLEIEIAANVVGSWSIELEDSRFHDTSGGVSVTSHVPGNTGSTL
jgi:hypothetical protein